MIRKTIAAAALAAFLAAGSILPAAAADTASQAPMGVTVAYGDLDLGTTAGQAELKSRLQAAADTLCRPILAWPVDSEPSVREHQILYRACIGRLAERAMDKVKADRNRG